MVACSPPPRALGILLTRMHTIHVKGVIGGDGMKWEPNHTTFDVVEGRESFSGLEAFAHNVLKMKISFTVYFDCAPRCCLHNLRMQNNGDVLPILHLAPPLVNAFSFALDATFSPPWRNFCHCTRMLW